MSKDGLAGVDWPKHVPAHCPPPDAVPPSGFVYRLVETIPATAEDMKSAYENGSFPRKDPCLRAALSCSCSPEYLEDLRRSVPRLKQRRVAVASLDHTHGVMKQTGAVGHHSLWLFGTVLPGAHLLFGAFP